jgi:hypothetical protein
MVASDRGSFSEIVGDPEREREDQGSTGQNAIQRERTLLLAVLALGCMISYSPEITKQVWSTNTDQKFNS